jgi:hypothetical protein
MYWICSLPFFRQLIMSRLLSRLLWEEEEVVEEEEEVVVVVMDVP